MELPASEFTAPAAKGGAKPARIDAGKVAKPFNTPSRRFKDGADVMRADLDGTPLDFDAMVEKGFITAA